MIELHVHAAAGDLEIVELAAKHDDVRFLVISRMPTGETRDKAVRRDDILNIQALDGGRDQGRVMAFLGVVTSGDVRIRGLEGNELLIAEIINARGAVAAGGGKGARGLDVDEMLDRASKAGAKAVSVGAIVKRRLGDFAAHPRSTFRDYFPEEFVAGLL